MTSLLSSESDTISLERLVDVFDQGVADRLRVLSVHVRRLVDERRANDPLPDDPYRGLYVSDEEADALAAENGERAVSPRTRPMASIDLPAGGTRSGDLVRNFGLNSFDLDVLIIAAAPDIEQRFEKLFGYLHDDITRRRPSVGLALELTGHGSANAWARRRLSMEAPLIRHGLLTVDEPGRPLLTRPLRVPDRVLGHLLGDDRIEVQVERSRLPSVVLAMPDAPRLGRGLTDGVTPVYLQDAGVGIGLALGSSALASIGLEALSLEISGAGEADPLSVVVAAIREARLTNRGLVVSVSEAVADANPEVLRVLADSDWPGFIVGSHPWDPSWSHKPIVTEVVPRPDSEMMESLWRAQFPELDREQLSEATRQLRLRPDQIVRASELAHRRATGASRAVALDDVSNAARAKNSSRLERLARRLSPMVTWDDLVLPEDVTSLLYEVETRYRRRDQVHGEWGMGGKNNRRLGVVSLFAGPSGVGKTMAAEALAGSLGLDLYQVNLATVVDKYIGETEKNLEKIFAAAEGVNGVILFDEADALFGKRSEVSDAKDRYANVEVAYLLQRLETYEGVAVLATNLRTNIDDAFTRRLDVVVDFPEPEEADRLVLWDRCIGRRIPRNDDIDLEFLAARFRLSGGNIRNIAVSAAFLAASDERALSMGDLVRATAQEYRKLGRLFTPSEFGHWHALLTS